MRIGHRDTEAQRIESGGSRSRAREAGLTLLEVVIALLLFSLISMFLLSGYARATQAIDRAETERTMAELLRLRLDLVTLEHEEYAEGTTEGFFPSDISTHILDEAEVLKGIRGLDGYRWEVVITPTIGAGSQGAVEVEGADTYEPLFPEEGGVSEDDDSGEEPDSVKPEDVDRMLFIQVTVYPPGYDEGGGEDIDMTVQPRSAWTAIHLPPEDTEDGG